jgi:hypothetical protein
MLLSSSEILDLDQELRLPPLEWKRNWEERVLTERDDGHFHILTPQPEKVLYFDTLNELGRGISAHQSYR